MFRIYLHLYRFRQNCPGCGYSGGGVAVCTMFCALLHYCERRRRRGWILQSRDQRSNVDQCQRSRISELRYNILSLLLNRFRPNRSQTCTKTIVYLIQVLYMLGDLFSKWADCPAVPPHVRTISLPFPCCPYRPAVLSSLFR